MSDVRTLRLASAQLNAASLEAFLTYQRTLIAELAGTSDARHASWAGRFAFAHARALQESGLDALTQQRLKVAVSEYAGKRSSWLTVKQRSAEAEVAVHHAAAHGRPAPQRELDIIERTRRELARLEDRSSFVERFGSEAWSALEARDLEVVTLHRDLSRLEGSGGHLHP